MIPNELKRMKPLQPGERLGQNRDSEYLGAEDIDPGTEPIVTIDALYNGMVTLQRGKENKDVLTFKEERVNGIRNVRPLIVNATNRKTLRKLFGSVKVEALVGQAIQLYIDPNVRDPSSGERIDGIRIRPRKPAKVTQTFVCADCGKQIEGSGRISPEDIVNRAVKRFGVPVCADCGKKRADAQQAAAANVADNSGEIADNNSDKEEVTDNA